MRNNKQLYESIMRDVSKIIKKSLNEGINNSEEYEDLLTYIYDNRSFANYDIKAALGAMEEERIPLNVADHNIYSYIYDLIEEFADENDKSEEWVEQYSDDLEQVFYDFVDKFEKEIWNENEDFDDRDAWDEYVNKYDLDSDGDDEW